MTTTGGLVFKNNELYREFGVGGGSGNIPIALPKGVEIDSQMNLSWSLSKESYVNYSREASIKDDLYKMLSVPFAPEPQIVKGEISCPSNATYIGK